MAKKDTLNLKRKTPMSSWYLLAGGAAMVVAAAGVEKPETAVASSVRPEAEQVRLYNGSPACYRQAWSTDVLQGIGAPTTDTNREVMIAWSIAEGGHFANRAKNNLLNTNRPMPGSEVAIKLDGIRGYKTPETGVEATVASIKLPWYSSIVAGFKRGNDAEGTIKAIRWPARVWAASHYSGVSWSSLRSQARTALAEKCGGEA